MVELYYIKNGKENFDEISEREKTFLPYYELNKISCFKQKKDRTLHFLSKWMLHQFIQKEGFADNIIQKISYDRFQKPFLSNFPYHFSFSHSGDIAVLAISPTAKIGIDIEQIPSNQLKVVPDIFSEQEKEKMLKNNNITNYFFHVWTAKESIIKALGKGFDLNFKEMNIETDRVMWQNYQWHLKAFSIHKDYVCHLATDKKIEVYNVQEMCYN
jgi:4'-phosphopantetheinyl transferase